MHGLLMNFAPPSFSSLRGALLSLLGTFWVDLRGGLGSASREGVTRFRLLLVCCIDLIFGTPVFS